MHTFTDLVDLASARVGGEAIAASDDFFATRENLLQPGPAVFIEGKYTENGKWMDGWESRRKRADDHDWCMIRLGLPGIIHGFDVDTAHFLGNYPSACSIDAATVEGNPDAFFPTDPVKWVPLLPKSALMGGKNHLFAVDNRQSFTHVRLNIFPDGGVARLRVYGSVHPNWSHAPGGLIDLASIRNGGVVTECSDQFFGSRHNIIMPGRAVNMGDGWETKRKRRSSFEELMADADWLIIRLGARGVIRKIEADTNHFKGNFPDNCIIEGCNHIGEGEPGANTQWQTLLERTPLQASNRHYFHKEVQDIGPITHVRLNIYPDGGVSRLRLWGELA